MKRRLGPINALYPMPTTLVGTLVEGRVNWITIAHVGIMNHGTPQYVSIGVNKRHFSNAGIRENKAFSICLPDESLVRETDYVGLVSGKTTDKSELFKVFYGELGTAPMAEECPVCMECRLHSTVDFPTHEVFVGEIAGVYADEAALTDGKIDLARLRPLLFDFSSVMYWSIGSPVAKCWHVGKELKLKEKTS